jgi:hypothetical protein
MAHAMCPALAHWPPGGDATRFLSRRFADRHIDLDVDFDLPRTTVVTDLIARCLHGDDGEPISTQSAWDWTVSERLQGLLAIAHASVGPSTAAVATCNSSDCRGQVELELDLARFASSTPMRIEWQSPDGDRLGLRQPTGEDLRVWFEQAQAAGNADPSWLAARLLDAQGDRDIATVPCAWLAPLAAALDTIDPLTDLTLEITCPYCDRALTVDVDIERLLIDSLRQRQRRLVDHVHCLAGRYHWSERDIVEMPEWRRDSYLARIAAESA